MSRHETPVSLEVTTFSVSTRADQGEAMRVFCVQRQQLAHIDAGDVRANRQARTADISRSERLEVVCFELTGPAMQKQEDGRGFFRGIGAVFGGTGGRRALSQQSGQAQSAKTEQSGTQDTPPIDAERSVSRTRRASHDVRIPCGGVHRSLPACRGSLKERRGEGRGKVGQGAGTQKVGLASDGATRLLFGKESDFC